MGNSDSFDDQLRAAQKRLKVAKTRVTIRRKRDALYLRATLPPKPGSGHVRPHRYELPTKLPASKDGLKRAEIDAKYLGSLIARKEFNWANWLGETPRPDQTISELVAGFKAEYMGTHSLSEATWNRHWQPVYDALPSDSRLNATLLVATALDTSSDSRKRREYCLKLQKLANYAGIPIDLKPYQGSYSSTRPQMIRDLPTDQGVGEWWKKIPNPAWQSFYGMVATFGLRPHEFWHCQFIDSLTLEVTEGKTGPRTVKALYPEWVEQWGLTDIKRPKVTAKVYRDYGDRASTQFRRYKLPFSPYDLRHAWAIRASITFRLQDTIAARMMGHSVLVHNRTYHRWLNQAKSDEVYLAAIATGPKAPERQKGESC